MVRRGDLFPPHHFGPGMTRWTADEYLRWYADGPGGREDRPAPVRPDSPEIVHRRIFLL